MRLNPFVAFAFSCLGCVCVAVLSGCLTSSAVTLAEPSGPIGVVPVRPGAPSPAILLVLVLLSCKSYGQSEFQAAHAKFSSYWKEIFAPGFVPGHDPDKTALIRKQQATMPHDVTELIEKGILVYLNDSRQSSSEALQQAIDEVLTPDGMQVGGSPGNVSVVTVGPSQTYVVGFDVGVCATCSNTWLGVFQKSDGAYSLRYAIEHAASGQSVRLFAIGPEGKERKVLLAGTTWGDAHSRLSVRLYDVRDGLHEVWSQLELPNGEVSVKGNRISLTSRSTLGLDFRMVRKDFTVTGTDVVLVNRFEFDP